MVMYPKKFKNRNYKKNGYTQQSSFSFNFLLIIQKKADKKYLFNLEFVFEDTYENTEKTP